MTYIGLLKFRQVSNQVGLEAICKYFTEDDLHFVVQVLVTLFNDNKVDSNLI